MTGKKSSLVERRRTEASWRDGDQIWLGRLLCLISAVLVIVCIWLLVR